MSDGKTKIGIVGASGYTGGELIRILHFHSGVELVAVQSRSYANQPVSAAHPDLIGELEIKFQGELEEDLDVVFLCTPHGKAKEFLKNTHFNSATKIIDLSTDHRDGSHEFTYGLPELNQETIAQSQRVANPGCFATAIQLALLPALKHGMIEGDIHATAITGSTGAGIVPTATTHFSWRSHNVGIYKLFNHQHLGEINATLTSLGAEGAKLHWVPMRGPFTRGILASLYWRTDATEAKAKEIYENYYSGHPFTWISHQDVDLKQVVGSNKCLLQIQKHGDMMHVTSVIDNLIKGAAGQAVQNMNLMLGLPETTGLGLKAVVH